MDSLIAQLARPDTPVIRCYNKADLVLQEDLPAGRDCVSISAKSGEGVEALLRAMEAELCRDLHRVTLLLPYSMGGQVDLLHSKAQVLRCDYLGEGIEMEVICDGAIYGRLSAYEVKV